VPVIPSSSVLRSARILSELAGRPLEDASLTDLARRLGIHKTSCQTLMLALVESGLVTRGPKRTYRLGPGLIQLGEAAKSVLRIPEAMTSELAGLSTEFAVTSLAGKRAGLEIVVVGVHEVVDPLGFTIPLGQRMPLEAPFGSLYVAWDTADEITGWIERATPAMSDLERRQALHSLELVRQRGCSITVRRPSQARFRPITRTAIDVVEARSSTIELPEPPTRMAEWTVLGIQAPVFDRSGEMLCTVALTGFPYPLAPGDLLRIADRVKAAAAVVAAPISQVGTSAR
jgi:DNA-binding IclR family transcriptional regulator